jgi:hydrogenase maturation protease
MTWPRPVRVVGLGSPAGDDALGWEVVGRLREQVGDVDGIEFHRAEGPGRLLDLVDGRGTLVLIDAARSGAPAGTIHHLAWPGASLEPGLSASTHGLDPAAALWLAAALGLLPAQVHVFGVEAAEVGPAAGLSPAVAGALPEVVRQVGDALRSPGDP